MTDRVVTIEFSAVVAGIKMDVHAATIHLGVNAVPSIELMVAPTFSKTPSPLKPAVVKPVISDFSDLYTDLADKAEGLMQTGDVDIIVHTNDINGKSEERLSIKGWVLSEVGLSNVIATSAPHLAVVLQHPMCYLTKVGSIYEIPKSDKERNIAEAASGSNSLLSIVDKVYDTVRNGSTLFFTPPDDMPTVFRQSLGVGIYDPQRYLVEKPEKLFLASELGEGSSRMASAIARMVLPDSSGTSTWDMIKNVAGSLLLSVTQDQSDNFTGDRLVLEPTKPWKPWSITLRDEDCFGTDIPGMDPFKLVGVMARKPNGIGMITEGMRDNGNPDRTNSLFHVLYIPEGLNPRNADGRIMNTSAPAPLVQAFREDAPYGSHISGCDVEFLETYMTGMNTALRKYCQAVYEITVGSMMTSNAQMALGFRDVDGNLILPGNTCRFMSQESAIYYGYIRNVVHYMSTEGRCSTTVNMSYVRPEEQFKVQNVPVINSGGVNVAYGA